MLTTTGIFVPARPGFAGAGPGTWGSRAPLLATALACLWLAFEGGRGFIHPRLLVLAPAGAAAAIFGLTRPNRTTLSGAMVPLLLGGALLTGSPPPPEGAATLPLGLYAGRDVDFTGTVRAGGGAVARAAMLCCRADAEVLTLPLARPVAVPAGTWVRVRGRMQTVHGVLRLGAARVERVAAPADPFAYL